MPRGKCSSPEKEAERSRKISDARKKRKEMLGYINAPETRIKIGVAGSRRKATPETRAKMSRAMKGRTPANHAAALAAAHAAKKATGAESSNWKGDAVGYSGLHIWIRKQRGTPSCCEQCGTTTAKRYEWANVSGQYKRDLADWIRLCTLCHRRMDRAALVAAGWSVWNKGVKVQTNTGRTHFKKGIQNNPTGGFQKGLTPHNKHLVPKPCKHCGESFQPRESTRNYCSRKCYWASMKKGMELRES